jgi:hypothetical protein
LDQLKDMLPSASRRTTLTVPLPWSTTAAWTGAAATGDPVVVGPTGGVPVRVDTVIVVVGPGGVADGLPDAPLFLDPPLPNIQFHAAEPAPEAIATTNAVIAANTTPAIAPPRRLRGPPAAPDSNSVDTTSSPSMTANNLQNIGAVK